MPAISRRMISTPCPPSPSGRSHRAPPDLWIARGRTLWNSRPVVHRSGAVEGEPHPERASLARAAAEAERASPALDQPADEEQAPAAAPARGKGAGGNSEEARLLVGWDAGSFVRHVEADAVALSPYRHSDGRLFRRGLDGVGEEVLERLAHSAGVAVEGRRHVVVDHAGETHR